ncbi:MAG TPA: hypothetical protein VIJ04_21405 [Xanthobacteraceae bacterium]
MSAAKSIVELGRLHDGFRYAQPILHATPQKPPHSPRLSAKNANHGGNVTIARPQIKQTAKKYSRQIREMAPLAEIS